MTAIDTLAWLIPLAGLGLLTGLDNFQVGAAIGASGQRSVRRIHLAAAFGFFEAIMPVAGWFLGASLLRLEFAVEWAGPAALLLCGILILAGSMRKSSSPGDRRWFLLSLPIILSLDNLFAGAALGALGFPVWAAAAFIGLISSVLCFAGLSAGQHLHRWHPRASRLAAGCYLIVAAVLIPLIER